MIGPTNKKNWSTVGSDPVPDADFGSLFHLRHHYGMGNFRRFITIYHIRHRQIFTTLLDMTDADKITCWQRSSKHPDQNPD